MPGLGVAAHLVQVFESLALELGAGVGVPGDLDRILDLAEKMAKLALGDKRHATST